MSQPTQKLNWRDLLDETKGLVPEGYVLYLRRSKKQKKGKDDEEVEKASRVDLISIEQQREACKYIAETRGLKIVAVFQEEESAKVPEKRPEFKKMLEFLKNSKEQLGILAWAPDRLTRNALEAGVIVQYYMLKHIIDFQFVTYFFTQDDSGIEYLMMEFARAMGYSLRLRKNVRRGMMTGYFEGNEWQFTEKFGYKRFIKTLPSGEKKKINFLIPHELADGRMGEFQAVQKAYRLRLQGFTYEKIIKALHKQFIDKKGELGNMTLKKLAGGGETLGILHDPFYYGIAKMDWGQMDLMKYRGWDDDGNPLEFVSAITEEEFLKCQAINNKKSTPKNTTHDYIPLRGKVKCADCGSFMTPDIKKKEFVYYYCRNDSCSAKKVHTQSSGKMVKAGISGKLLFASIGVVLEKCFKLSPHEFTRYLLHIEKRSQSIKKMRGGDLKRLQARKGHINNKIEEASVELQKSLSQISKPDTAKRVIESNEAIVDGLKDELNEVLSKEKYILEGSRAWTQDLKKWLELMQNAYTYWENADFNQKRRIAEKIFLELTVKNGEIVEYQYEEPYSTCRKIILEYTGDPKGNRTPLVRMKTWCPNH